MVKNIVIPLDGRRTDGMRGHTLEIGLMITILPNAMPTSESVVSDYLLFWVRSLYGDVYCTGESLIGCRLR